MTSGFLKNERGNFALFSAIALVPLLMCAGVAIDFARMESAKSKLQDISDAAALRSANAYMQAESRPMKDARVEGREFFRENIDRQDKIRVRRIAISRPETNTLRVESKAQLKPMFMQVFGYPRFEMAVASEVNIGSRVGAEIAIAFDTTSSMTFGTKWNDSMDSILSLLEGIKTISGSDNFYVGLVPFQDRVNIGKSASRAGWLNGSPPISAAPDDWRGCVQPREVSQGGFTWSVNDDRPTLQPFDYTTRYMPGGLGDKPSGITCPTQELVSPTADIQSIIDTTKTLTNDGTGRQDVGMAWAWRMLSPKWRGQWGLANYPTANVNQRRKYLIFMSDGMTAAYKYEMSKEEDWGHNMGSRVGFEHIAELCSKIKAEGIQIYMLHLTGNSHSDPYYQQCASTPAHYFRIDEPKDMENVFSDILSQFQAEIRITH